MKSDTNMYYNMFKQTLFPLKLYNHILSESDISKRRSLAVTMYVHKYKK